ncbi:hypothetical protein LINPERHAP2_LOCUS34471, partial [Linum perenne]
KDSADGATTPSNNLWVGNLAQDVTDSDLIENFSNSMELMQGEVEEDSTIAALDHCPLAMRMKNYRGQCNNNSRQC